ncbi:Gfo/Idh/MocA family protein [Pelagibacterium montanilacus]|uniref:Gfo/Idh/MocA family protein n=1 Tax=Pelagibacterium montanilacus TaxID=2185280 RepID=UPI000F8ED2B3|nr:Gfo/Idh/MocA family oxidoreductase [Pelagibacterium montanilacus]
MKEIRLGIVGAGFMGQLHAQSASGLETAQLAAIVDMNAQLGSDVAGRYGATHYRDIDAALAADAADAYIVVLPDTLHRDVTVRLLEAGKPVLVEKPMAHALDDAKAMARAEKSGGRLMVGQILRFDPRYNQAAQAVRNGEIGEPLHGSSGRFTNSELGLRMNGGSSVCFYLGVHDVDALQWISGQNVTRVFSRQVSKQMPKLGVQSEDAYFTTCEMTSGMVGQLYFGWTLPKGIPTGLWARTEVIGTEGVIDLDVRDSGLRMLASGGWSLPDGVHWPEVNGRIMGDLYEEQRHFVQAVREDLTFLVPTPDALRNVAVNDAILRSVKSGQPEDVENWDI